MYKTRADIERYFGGVLGPLPAWVRGLERVRTWIWAKFLINAVRRRIHKDLLHP